MRVSEAFRQLSQALATRYGDREARSMTRVVFEDAFGIRNACREDSLPPFQLNRLRVIQERLLAGEPVQYILGQARFYGLDLEVGPAVLIPRQETEELVHWVLESQRAGEIHPERSMLDVGTGSGCIPIALGKHGQFAELFGIDNSQPALAIAAQNAERNRVQLHLAWADVLDPKTLEDLPRVGLLISNPPYIPKRERDRMPGHVLDHEPEMALFVEDDDPLIFYRAILDLARRHLDPYGWLYLELNEFNAGEVKRLLADANYIDIEIKKDMQGKPRMARARKPAHP